MKEREKLKKRRLVSFFVNMQTCQVRLIDLFYQVRNILVKKSIALQNWFSHCNIPIYFYSLVTLDSKKSSLKFN